MSKIISVADGSEAFDEAVSILSKGSVVVLPVDGVYAIVADAFRASATQRIFAARRRSRVTPLPVLLRSPRQVSGLAGEVPEYADRLTAAYWPGPLTLILPASEGMSWDLGNGKGTVQLRQPTDDLVLRLIARIGPLACTAANRLKQDRPTTVEQAKLQLGVLVPLYLDGGELDGTVSTIVDATAGGPVVVREGAIPADHIELVAAGELPWGDRPDMSAAETSVEAEEPDTTDSEEEPVVDESVDDAEEPPQPSSSTADL